MKNIWYIFLFVLALCSCSHKESILDVMSNTQYEESGHHSSWAGKEWHVFSWKGDKVFAAGILISPFAYDSIFWIIKEEFGEPTYSRRDFVRNPGLALSDTVKFDLARWENLEDIYYWCNDSYVICWSFFDMDSTIMKGYSYLTIDQLKVKQPETHVSDIFLHAQYGDTHAISEWAGRHWEIFGNAASPDFEALTLRITPYTFDSIRALICQEYGAPTYNHHTLPSELVPQEDTGTFWMAGKDHSQFFYWCRDTINIGWGLFDMDSTMVGCAWLYIERLEKVGPYEAYIDSLRASSENDFDIWGYFDHFKDARQKKFVNDIYRADSYEVYFGLLNEYLPFALPSNATEYDRYLASVIQKDSLLSFPGDEGCTADIYLFNDYELSFTRWNIQKFTDQCKISGIYSIEVDSAWQSYMKAMLTAVDSVVMYRPQCQGTISGMEYLAFVGRLDDDYLNSMLDALFYNQRHNAHAAISDEAISAAYKSLKSHLKEHISKKGFEDLDGCYVPLSKRYAALDKDEEAWSAFISARNNLSCSLKGKKKKAFDIATNNLKRSKLWLLKNEYRCYSTSASIGEHDEFYNVLLPFDCSDEELKQYDFKTRYEAEFGEFNMFE